WGFDRVDVVVTVSDPVSGRYGNGKFLYLSCFFDFNGDGDWWDVFECVLPGDAPEHLLIQAVGGPGAASVVNQLPDNKVVIDPSVWAGPPSRQSRQFELYFYSPEQDDVAETIWSRFRLEYDDVVWPSPDNKFLGVEFDYSLFGEVEDYFPKNSPNKMSIAPAPPDGMPNVRPEVVLSWSPGIYAAYHDVYFGTDWADVNDANTTVTLGVYCGRQPLEANSYDPPGPLDLDTTYYWRIDEVNDACAPYIWKGPVWSFTTVGSIVNPNMVAWYKLDEGSGNEAFDSSGYKHHGDVDTDQANWDANDGRWGGSLWFDNDTDVELPFMLTSSINKAMSVSIWLKNSNRPGSDNWAFGWGDENNYSFRAAVVAEDGRNVYFQAGNDTNDVIEWDMVRDGLDPAALEDWHHHVFVKDEVAGNMSIYFDAEVVESNSMVNNTLINIAYAPGKIGAVPWDSNDLVGKVDDFRVFNKALNDVEVETLFRGGDVAKVWKPDPRNGATDVPSDVTLSWRPGDYAGGHDVYLGTDWDDVNDATTASAGTYRGRQDPCEYAPPGYLELDTTYYWRIDEVNDPNLWKGDVWRFTLADYIILDDFESYDEITNRIEDTWDEGWNGAIIALGIWPDPCTVVHGGKQSMMYWYDNTTKWDFYSYHSMVERAFDIPTDLTYGGRTKALALYFYGDPGNDANDTEQLYVALRGSYAKLRYSTDAGNDNNDLRLA
ncbi:MAG: LamG-like jellyroll fold domain-containing protein, partial [Planctomycetota bacterium]